MKDILLSQIGFWSAFTIIFMIVVLSWFFMKMVKLSKQDRVPLDED
jgi:flagellar biogenesis protein FliO